ncbi:MAG: RsmD family RNA methyltransferase [Alphaproteobacteria bacterium]|nr:RsmD family RNA methyltransferase [Alphaproteobacteria bacterium]MBQ8729493.1 RsmD family RNA methyltransferase [Alphaproteobacteria bacterium]
MDSKLQIISGQYKGRKLRLPPDARPTQNRARIALFNMLESGIIDKSAEFTVWDAFAGSGAFGLECLSRYSNARVIFTDVAPTSVRTVRDNLAMLGVGARASIFQADAVGNAQKFTENADLIFIDAPYDEYELGGALVARIGRVARPGTILVWEQETKNAITPDETVWEILRDKTYGRARFLILQKKEVV